MNKNKLLKNSNSIPSLKNMNFSSFIRSPAKMNNLIKSQYSNLIDETIVLSEKEILPEEQLVVFFIQRAKKIYNISKYRRNKNTSPAYVNLLCNNNKNELSQLINILENGIKANAFQNCNTHSTGKAMLNAIKGFDFLIYQGESFNKLKDEIEELIRIFLNSVKL